MCQDLALHLQTATYEVAMRKAGNRTRAWIQATKQSQLLTLAHRDLSIINFARVTTQSDTHTQSLARAALESDMAS